MRKPKRSDKGNRCHNCFFFRMMNADQDAGCGHCYFFGEVFNSYTTICDLQLPADRVRFVAPNGISPLLDELRRNFILEAQQFHIDNKIRFFREQEWDRVTAGDFTYQPMSGAFEDMRQRMMEEAKKKAEDKKAAESAAAKLEKEDGHKKRT